MREVKVAKQEINKLFYITIGVTALLTFLINIFAYTFQTDDEYLYVGYQLLILSLNLVVLITLAIINFKNGNKSKGYNYLLAILVSIITLLLVNMACGVIHLIISN
jgi:hypothetical protein